MGSEMCIRDSPDGSNVVIDARKTVNMDNDVSEIIQEFQESAEYRKIQVEILELASPGVSNQAKIFQQTMGTVLKAS